MHQNHENINKDWRGWWTRLEPLCHKETDTTKCGYREDDEGDVQSSLHIRAALWRRREGLVGQDVREEGHIIR